MLENIQPENLLNKCNIYFKRNYQELKNLIK